jgi:thymidylate synthase
MSYNLETIIATTLPDAWFQTIYKCIEVGKEFIINRGSYVGQKRLEFDYITIQIKHPEIEPLLPEIPEQYNIPNPVKEGYLEEYLPYLMTGVVKNNESYTYGQRLTRYPIESDFVHNYKKIYKEILIQEDEIWDIWSENKIITKDEFGYYLNQIELVIWTYKNKGYRNNQMTMQIAKPSDLLLQDPPCLRSIDTRIQDNKLIFIVYFRSWDLWNGLPANLGAIQMMKEYMATEIGVNSGETIATSKGLHIYDYVFELGECLRGKTISEFRNG